MPCWFEGTLKLPNSASSRKPDASRIVATTVMVLEVRHFCTDRDLTGFPTERENAMSDPSAGQVPGFAALLTARVSDDADLADGLRKVAAAGCGLLANCAGASVTIIERGRASTAASTDDDTLALDFSPIRRR